MQKYIDAHCHLQNMPELHNVLLTALDVGVERFICNATKPDDWDSVLDIMQKHNMVCGGIGIHPWYVGSVSTDWRDKMRDLLKSNSALIVGEIGLDKNYPDIIKQENFLIEQLSMATEFNRAVQIHCVGSWGRLLEILKDFAGVAVLHGFSASVEVLKHLLQYGNVYFSFSSAIMDEWRRKLVDVVKNTPLDRILVESDNLPPTIIPNIVRRIAEIKCVASDEAADIIYNNSLRLLKNGQIA